MKSFAYIPAENGGRDFNSRAAIPEELFSDLTYFKTVFASGGDVVAEEAEVRKAEREKFEKAMVVDTKKFNVNTMVKSNHHLDKFKNIREDEPMKKGIKLSAKQVKFLTEKQMPVKADLRTSPIA